MAVTMPPGHEDPAPTDLIAMLQDAGFGMIAQTIKLILQEMGDLADQFSRARVEGWIDELTNGTGRGRSEDDLRDDIFEYIVGVDRFVDQYGISEDQARQIIAGGNGGGMNFGDFLKTAASGGTMGTPDDVSPAPGAAGASEGFPGIMPGGELVQIQRDGQDDLFIQAYEWPAGSGQFVAWQYQGVEQLASVFGPDWAITQPRQMRDETWLTNSVTISDAVGEILGVDIGFGTFMQNIQNEIIASSAIGDPTIWGQMANDPEIQAILRDSVVNGWSEDQIQGELRNSQFWTQTLYPGIETFYASGSVDPEGEWRNYQARMEPALRALGIDPGSNGFRDEIGVYLQSGVDPDLAAEMVPIFQRASNSPQFAATLNAWMQRDIGQSLDFDTWFDVLAGQAPADVQEIVEKAQLQFVADQQSLGLSGSQIARIAEASDLSEREAARAFEQVSAQLLALGDDGLARYGLSEDDILASQTGIEATSGRSISEIKQIARKTALELGLADDKKLNLYVGYDPTRGTPTRPGLGAIAPTGG